MLNYYYYSQLVDVDFIASSTSFRTILPEGPVPITLERSMFCSLAKWRASGEAATVPDEEAFMVGKGATDFFSTFISAVSSATLAFTSGISSATLAFIFVELSTFSPAAPIIAIGSTNWNAGAFLHNQLQNDPTIR